MQSRRDFIKQVGSSALSIGALSLLPMCGSSGVGKRPGPNVVLVMTDDQGFGDMGYHGNTVIRTPNIDKFTRDNTEFSQFYVSPVCAPTRASLMTGRYNYRTRVTDTYKGRAMMDPDEYTLAEAFRDAGYRTGIFGKWHLGDNYPMRAMDQGFEESVVHRGGGLMQPSDVPGNTYFDPVLFNNGKPEKYSGYCMDVYTDAAIRFIRKHKNEPFFVYLPTNTPHSPLQVKEEYTAYYRSKVFQEKTSKVYGMVENIDDNFGRLLKELDALNLADNTIVIFLTDNGPAQWYGERYNSGFRGSKGTVYEGGIRVPFFVRWPELFRGKRDIKRIAAHIDIMPTLIDACNLKKPENIQFDGLSLIPLLKDENTKWSDRTLYFQWHRGDEPQLYRCFSARNQKYKLVQAAEGPGYEGLMPERLFKFELFDIENDPFEQNDIASENPEIVEKMKNDYKVWFENVSGTRGYAPPRIYLGTKHENPVVLTRQDWRGSRGWSDKNIGHWEVKVVESGKFDITLKLSKKLENDVTVYFKLGKLELKKGAKKGFSEIVFENVNLVKGEGSLHAWLQRKTDRMGVKFVEVRKLD